MLTFPFPATRMSPRAIAAASALALAAHAIASAAPRVTAVETSAERSSIRITFDAGINALSASPRAVSLRRPGPDGEFGTADDAVVYDIDVTRVEARVLEVTLRDPQRLEEPHELTLSGTSTAEGLATILALENSGELLPPPDLVERLRADIDAIQRAYPEMTGVGHHPQWLPGEVLVGLTDRGAELYESGDLASLEELNERYGAVNVDYNERLKSLRVRFADPYNPEVLAREYEALAEVRYAEPNRLIGDGPRVTATPPMYSFTVGWGDCPAGCIFHHTWVFRVSDGEVELVDESGPALERPLQPAVLLGLDGEFIDGEYTGEFPSGDGVPGGDFVYAFNWDGSDLPKPFRRGDANGDGRVDISDAVAILEFLFLGAAEPGCLDTADTDDDLEVNITDAVVVLAYLFAGGLPPAPPGPEECGLDPAPGGSLGCRLYRCEE